MRLRNGHYECRLCGEVLNIATDREPLVMINAASGKPNVRVIVCDGQKIHACPTGGSVETGNGFRTRHSATVLQAQGMVSVQANCSFDDALLLMETTAHATGETLEQVAIEVVAGRVRFDADSD